MSGWSEDGSLRGEAGGRTWVMSDLVGHGKGFILCPEGHGPHRG